MSNQPAPTIENNDTIGAEVLPPEEAQTAPAAAVPATTEHFAAPAPARPDDGLLSVIERAAMNPDVDIEKFERLVALKERAEDREAERAFNRDFAMMQAELPEIDELGRIVIPAKNANEQAEVRSKYALFEDIMIAVKPVLKAYGFGISHRIQQTADRVEVTAILMHRDGHYEETSMNLPIDASGSKNNVQGWGSSVSYAQRYTTRAILCISSRAPSDKNLDDDGNAAATGLTDEQAIEIDDLLVKSNANRAQFFKLMGVENETDSRKIPVKNYERAKQVLNDKIKRNATKPRA